jgi:hypothetical protein
MHTCTHKDGARSGSTSGSTPAPPCSLGLRTMNAAGVAWVAQLEMLSGMILILTAAALLLIATCSRCALPLSGRGRHLDPFDFTSKQLVVGSAHGRGI